MTHTTLKTLIAESDDFVKAPFFWNESVMPLCTRRVTSLLCLTRSLMRVYPSYLPRTRLPTALRAGTSSGSSRTRAETRKAVSWRE